MPPILEQAIQCRDWKALPDTGGVNDQEPGKLKQMTAHLSAYETIKSRQRARDVLSWIDANPDRYDYYGYLKQLVDLGVEETHRLMKERGAF